MVSIPQHVLDEAKARVEHFASQGELITPREAWLLSGETKGAQTLWSIAFALSLEREVNADDLNDWLEKIFPQYAKLPEPHHPPPEPEEN
ncbi:MAG TPA: hypothetical protein VFT72_19925 [Opitutaceae bacterium]|nr:hypothetical protein [Opitutaceae bacterium]